MCVKKIVGPPNGRGFADQGSGKSIASIDKRQSGGKSVVIKWAPLCAVESGSLFLDCSIQQVVMFFPCAIIKWPPLCARSAYTLRAFASTDGTAIKIIKIMNNLERQLA